MCAAVVAPRCCSQTRSRLAGCRCGLRCPTCIPTHFHATQPVRLVQVFSYTGEHLFSFKEGALFGEFVALGLLHRRCYTAVAEEPLELASINNSQLACL